MCSTYDRMLSWCVDLDCACCALYVFCVVVSLRFFSFIFFFFKQKTAYEMRISDWSSDVCSSDLSESLSKLRIPRIALPAYEAWGDLLRWQLKENVPGE